MSTIWIPRDATRQRLMIVVVSVVMLLMALPVLASPAESDAGIDWFTMAMKLAGGLALFLFGMEQMGTALTEVAGSRLKDILGRLTTNRFMGVATGAGVTAIIQSSSITTVMLVGFVSADVMNLTQAVGVILGANIGTTITAQIVAFPIKHYALLGVAIGFGMIFVGATERIRQYGGLIMGLGMVFYGMVVMGDAMVPLRTFEPFIDLMKNVSNPLVGIAIAAVFTALIQSSSATTGIIIVLASQGMIELEGGIALALGANVGTCATAGLAAIGKPRTAVRVAVAHVLFNIMGVLLIAGFIPQFVELARMVSPTAAGLEGVEALAAETPRQIANAHTIFNVLLTILFLPFAGPFANLVMRIVPDKVMTEGDKVRAQFQARHLDELLIAAPPLALSMVRRELSRTGQVVEEMLVSLPETLFVGDVAEMERVRDMDDQVDALYSQIAHYLSKVTRQNLSSRQSSEAMMLAIANTEIENVGDIVETHMFHLAGVCSDSEAGLGERELEALGLYHGKILEIYRSVVVAVEHDRRDTAQRVLDREEEIVGGMDELILNRQKQLMASTPTAEEIAAFNLMTDIMENLKRIYEHSKRIARLVTKVEYSTALVHQPE